MKPIIAFLILALSFNTYSFEIKDYDQENTFLNANVSSSLTSIHSTYVAARPDKQLHILAGTLISGTATTVTKQYLKNDENTDIKAMFAGTSAALLAGIAKEVLDAKGHGTVDKMDAIYTVAPAALLSFRFTYGF